MGTERTIQPHSRLSAIGATADDGGTGPATVCQLLSHLQNDVRLNLWRPGQLKTLAAQEHSRAIPLTEVAGH